MRTFLTLLFLIANRSVHLPYTLGASQSQYDSRSQLRRDVTVLERM